MKFEPFVMERTQSIWENQVEINLAESGVEPLVLGDPDATAVGPAVTGLIATRHTIRDP